MIMFRFISEIEEQVVDGKQLKKNEIASKLGVSPSYITQLFNGDKLMNFTMLAKIQKVFNITFEIKASKNNPSSSSVRRKTRTIAGKHIYHLSVDKTIYRKKSKRD
jgi:transcriptional regulator with XRE-family HTH domain